AAATIRNRISVRQRTAIPFAVASEVAPRSLVALLIMLLQQVLAPIARELTPDAMDVVGLVLRVVVLNQERRRLNTIVVRIALLDAARPCEPDVLAGLPDQLFASRGHLVRHVVGVLGQERIQFRKLLRVELRSENPARLPLDRRFAA